MSRLLRRLTYLFRRFRNDADLSEEIETHGALRQSQLESHGVTPEEARRASGRMIGQIAIARDDVHDLWIGSADASWRDISGGLRTLGSRPGFTALAVLSLALCIGANIVVFTVVNALWLRPPAIPNPDRVVIVTGMNDLSGTDEGFFFVGSSLERDLRSQPAFEAVAGQVATSGSNADYLPHITLDRVGREVETLAVTWQYFSVMGLRIAGRDFTKDDDSLGAPPVVIVSDRLWRTAFGGAPDVIGTMVAALPVPVRVVGVAPAGFRGARLGEQADLWVPRYAISQVSPAGQSASAGRNPPLLALARLKLGASPGGAARAIAMARDPRAPMVALSVIPIGRIYGSPVGRTIVVAQQAVLWIAAATAGLVLLAGCATLMALVLVSYERRRQELAIRMALGCSRARLVRTLVIELGALAATGAIAALAVAAAGLRALPALSLPGGLDLGRLDLSSDWRVLSFGVIGSVVTLAVAGYAPIRRATRHSLVTDLVASSARTTVSSLRLRRNIMVAHVAATVIVLVAAGLFVRTIVYGFTQGPGFDTERTLFVEVKINPASVPFDFDRRASDAKSAERMKRLLISLESLPGVKGVSIGRSPIGLDQAAFAALSRAFLTGSNRRDVSVSFLNVGPLYLDLLGVTRLAGRGLTDADVGGPASAAERPVVITQTFAQAMWPGQPATGETFRAADSESSYQVVGVVSDVALGSVRLGQRPGVFVATTIEQAVRFQTVAVTIRTSGDAAIIIASVRQAIAEVFPFVPHLDVATGREIVARDLGRERLGAWFFSGFGVVALVLGVSSVFGLVAYLAESRRREMGIRLALGALPGQVALLIVTAGLRPVVVGMAAGLAGFALLARTIDSLLIGVGRFDPATYTTVALLMLGCTAAAGFVAAWRVRRISPNEALRVE